MLALVTAIGMFLIAYPFDWVSMKGIPGGKQFAACFEALRISEALR